jgi:hypothetical protein
VIAEHQRFLSVDNRACREALGGAYPKLGHAW